MQYPKWPDQTGPVSTGPELIDAGYRVGQTTILAGLNLHLSESRIGILGRNGSGKTTLLRLIAGLVAPTSGCVRVGGVDPSDRRAMLREIGILFQNPDHQIIFPTVEEELAFGLRQQGRSDAEAKVAARGVLDAEGRVHWAKAPVATLSHGQRHYLCLMAILAMAPATILLDEPFAGLDLPTTMRLTRALDAAPQRLITITHDPAMLAGYARVIWLDAGRVRADGAPGDVIPAFRVEMEHLGAADADTDLTR